MPALTISVDDTFNRGQSVQYDVRDLLESQGVLGSNIEAVTSVLFGARILTDANTGGKVSAWEFVPRSQGSSLTGNWTSSKSTTVPISPVNQTAWLGRSTVPPMPGQQVGDGEVVATFYPVDGEAVVDGGVADGTYIEVSLELIDATTAAIYGAGSVTGQITDITIFYTTVNDGIEPTSCGVFGVGAFGAAVFGQVCANVTARFTSTPLQGTAPVSFSFDASTTTVTPNESVSYNWDFGDGSTGTGISPTHVYTTGGLHRVTLIAVSASGAYDVTNSVVTVAGGTSNVPTPRNLGDAILGSCNIDRYSVEITRRGGYGRLADLSEWVESIDWNRVMDDRSTAEVVIRKRSGCHEPLSFVDPWATELRIWRDDEMVWEGPVTEYTEQDAFVVINASDITEWMQYRRITSTIDHEVLPGVAPTEIAREIIEQAYAPDDPRVLEYVDIRSGGDLITRKIDVEDRTTYAEQELRALAGSFIDYTVVGRRIIVWPDNYYLSSVGTLMQRHLVGDGWSIRSRGEDYGSRFIMEGDAVTGIAGGVSERYGLVEQPLRDDTILDTATATQAAQRVYDMRAARPPRWLIFSDGTQLAHDAPITMRQLVPGVRLVADISGEDIAQPFRQNMRLTRVSVGVDQDGEKVQIGAFAVGFDGFPLGVIGDEATTSLPQNPVASFTTSTSSGEVPLTVNVNGQGSYDPDGSIASWAWNWGDGSGISYGDVQTHQYIAAGTYTIILTVTDNSGLIDSQTTQITVTNVGGNVPPDAQFSYVDNGGGEVDFNAAGSSDPDGTIASYVWNFGDGNSDTGVSPTHTYAGSGSYQVTLTVTDDGGATDEVAQQIIVGSVNQPPTATFGYTLAINDDTPLFDASGSSDPDGTIVDYLWNFGDSPATQNTANDTITHTYTENGTYQVTLTVTDDGGATDEYINSVTVQGFPTVRMEADVSTGLTVNFDATATTAPSASITSYEFDFGDGSPTVAGGTPSHTYATDGEYTVLVRATTSLGLTSPWTPFIVNVSAGAVPTVDMIVLGDSIANLHTPTYNSGGDQFTPRTRWQDQLAATLAARHARPGVARKYWSQNNGATLADTDTNPGLGAGWYDDGPESAVAEGAFIQWDASAPGYLSEMWDTGGVNSLGDTANSNFYVTHPPAANPRYVFICVGFNDIHAPQCGGLPPRDFATIVSNIQTLCQPYKNTAEYIFIAGQWDINEAHPSAGFWDLICGNDYHTADDMVPAQYAPLQVQSNLQADPTCTAIVRAVGSPNDPLSDKSNDAIHPIAGGHTDYYQLFEVAMAAEGLI